ncbi:MAG: D-galactarate dehydratase, partial [Pseudomonadota bacterium]
AVVTEETVQDAALGKTIASLGPPADTGIWLETPLVGELTSGRIAYQGKTINIELRPSGGAPGSGSQISLAAMRLIEAPLTSLPELDVFATP